FYGRVTQPQNEKLHDLSLREMAVLVPFVFLIFLMGLAPNLFFEPMQASVNASLKQYEAGIGSGGRDEVPSRLRPRTGERPEQPGAPGTTPAPLTLAAPLPAVVDSSIPLGKAE
ncbi:MAG TPA: hypothetical protein VL860_06250, partial [Planctomycetota bacterium]|nr:hypothetical protein [Planctomycetota bacterium]